MFPLDWIKKFAVILIIKRPAYVMLPVYLGSDPWFDNSGLQALENINDLIRPKRFVAALILGILTLIAILTSFAVSTTALAKEIQTAIFVNEIHKNISVAVNTTPYR